MRERDSLEDADNIAKGRVAPDLTVDATSGQVTLRAEVPNPDGVLLPGLVDMHVHLREPGREDTETIATGSAILTCVRTGATSFEIA